LGTIDIQLKYIKNKLDKLMILNRTIYWCFKIWQKTLLKGNILRIKWVSFGGSKISKSNSKI